MTEKSVEIEPISEAHIDGFRAVVDTVARERRYLCSLEGFSPEETQRFVQRNLGGDGVQFVALHDGNVVGWCDIVRRPIEGFQHSGSLGMGLLSDYRGKGLGRRLLETAIAAAPDIGISRIELEVFASNAAAISLYRNVGFIEEGVKRKARILDGNTDDIICMAFFT